METEMKKTGLLLVALAGLSLAGCAGRYYDDDYRYNRYHGYSDGGGYWRDHDRDYRDRDYRDGRGYRDDGYRGYQDDRY
jgi:hypothetical protein